MNTQRKRPLLRGFTFTSGGGTHIAVHCPHCDRMHYHGWERGLWRPEHRQAHCAGGPFSEGGYYIAPFRKRDLADIGAKP